MSDNKEEFGQLGQGALLRIFDRTMITHRGIRELILDTAESNNIPYQYFVSQGGTDAGSVHTSSVGVPSSVIGIRSEEHTSELQSRGHLVCRLLLEIKKNEITT